MSLKKKLGVGVVSAALGLSLIGGGTYAYFSDQV
ncbi:CalY family protein, partial [Bacillus toyonensis]